MIQEVTIMSGRLQVILTGSLFAEDAKAIQAAFCRYIGKGHKTISIDLAGVDYIDCTGLGMLLSINKNALEMGGRLEIKGLQGMAKDLIELTQLDKVFTIV